MNRIERLNAFPFVTEIQRTESGSGEQHFGEPGMSLRQWYASMALTILDRRHPDYSGPDGPHAIAVDAFAIADEMISEGGE